MPSECLTGAANGTETGLSVPQEVNRAYGEAIVSLRGSMQQAIQAITRGDRYLARDILQDALDRDRV